MDIVDRLRAMGGYLDYDCEVSLSSIADELQTLRAKVEASNILVNALDDVSDVSYHVDNIYRRALAAYKEKYKKLCEIKS